MTIWSKKKNWWLLFICLATTLFAVENNLMPDGSSISKQETVGMWHTTPYNGATTQVDYASRRDTRTLEINRSGASGYSAWRIYLALTPGDYTLETELRGTGHGSIDAYAFNDKGPIAPLIILDFPADKPKPIKILKQFTVKQGTTKVRFGFTCNDTGDLAYVYPRIFKGHLKQEQLPPQPVPPQITPKVTDLLKQINAFELKEETSQAVSMIDRTTGIATTLDAGTMMESASAKRTSSGWRFLVPNRPVDIGRGAWKATFPRVQLETDSLIEMDLQVSGMHYAKKSYPVITLGDLVVLTSSEIYSDNRPHKVLFRVPKQCGAETLTLNLQTSADKLEVNLTGLRMLSHPAALVPLKKESESENQGIAYVNMGRFHRGYLQDELIVQLQQRAKVYDPIQLPETGVVQLNGARFQIDGKRVLVKGQDIFKRPASMEGKAADGVHPKTPWEKARDAAITLPLMGKAKELWLLLNARMTPFVQIDAPPAMPPRFSTHEVLDVEIVYADGRIDHSYPYSLADKGFTVQRFLGAYAVPLDASRELKQVIIHGYFRGGVAAVSLAGATLNRTLPNLIPQSVLNPEPYRVSKLKDILDSPLQVTQRDGRIILENNAYRLVMQTRDFFAITELSQKLNPEAPMTIGTSGFEMDWAGRLLTGRDFQVAKTTMLSNGATLELVAKDNSVPLALLLTIQGDATKEIRFNATIQNTGTSVVAPRVRFPVLDRVILGNNQEAWIYFPKYCTLMSKEITYALCPGDERAYFVQFYDGFNPKAGYGLSLITHNHDGVVLDYGLFKTSQGLKYFIQYPAEWHKIAPREEDKLVETSLVLHTGDWHGGLAAYKKWVNSWYKPLKPGKLDWWTHTWIVYGQLLTKPYGWVIPTYNEKTKSFIMVNQLQVAKQRWGGEIPITHVWGWNMPAKLYPGEKPRKGTPNSNYADGEFNPANYRGGLNAMKAEYDRLKKNGSFVSLYTIPAYLPKACPIGRDKGEELTQILASGARIEDDQCWFPCSWVWRDIFVKACIRAQKATGCNAVYVDISPFPRSYTCYAKNHGHSIPLNTNVSSRRILKTLREKLPEGVALWHEDPACDIDVQYSSGSFTYYAGRTWAHRAPNYAESTQAPEIMPAKQSILRFVFPLYKTFALPVGYDSGKVEMDQFAIHFFNGDGVGDATFGMYNDRSIAIVQKIARLQRLHADTFLTLHPEPLVPTLAGGIEANRFPADAGGECIWTLWNGRYSTFRGAVLEVDTIPGEQWRDLWNDRPLPVIHRNGKTIISLELPPQAVGAVIRTVKN